MKKLYLTLLLFVFSSVVTALDRTEKPEIEISENPTNGVKYRKDTKEKRPSLNDLMNQKNISDNKENNFRFQVLKETAYTLGFRGGVVDKANELITILNSRADKLDLIFNFSPLISEDGVLPPVVVESSDVAAFSKDQVRTANHVYKIQIEEKFVSNPPTWTDYLFVGLPTKFTEDYISNGIKPKTSEEIRLWKDSVKLGWKDGQKFAVDVLEANFNRLVRDYTGMMRYSELLHQKMITKSKTARSISTITGDGKQIILGDELQRLIEKSSFELNIDKWRPSTTVK
jgi:defect in organelle trafficking protein DotC